MYRFLCLALLGWLGTNAARAQDAAYRPFYTPDTLRRHTLAVAQRAALRAEMPVPKTGSSEYRADYRRVVDEASADAYNAIRYAALLDPEVEPYVQQVFARILRANPQLPAGTRLVLTRNPEPNARAVGRSTVLLNLGLLPRLENESQLAYVLCHELAHGASHHLETGLRDRLTAIHSKELKREFRRIVNSEYNIGSQLKTLALGFSLSSSYHQRRFERQADSLGYVLLARTTYEAPQAYRTLQLLDAIDQPENPAPLPLAAQFSCAEFPRAFGGPAASRSIFTVQAAAKTTFETSDTLKSHPDCGKRMRFVQGLAQGRVAEGAQPSPPDFDRIRRLSRLELVQSWFDYECYDHALFEALQLLPQQPQSSYLRSMVQLSLFGLRQHLQAHTFTEVVSNVSEHQAANFNELLRTLYELRPDDFRGLSACFARAAPPAAAPPEAVADEFALAGRCAAAALAAPPTDPAVLALRDDYRRRYPQGRFKALLPPPPARAVGHR